jgi:twitching motility protein PilT
MRSELSIKVALQAGESGHLCISTIHTADVRRTIDRIANMVSEQAKGAILGRLAESLEVIISQRLLPMKGRKDRILASEVMVSNPSMREVIRDVTAHKKITSLLAKQSTGTNNHTFDQDLISLVKNNLITLETAESAATNPSDLMRSLRVQ